MRAFFKCINNGVIAIVTEEVYHQIEARQAQPEDTRQGEYPTKIFTFVDPAYAQHSTYQGFVTGSTELMDELLEGSFVATKSFYVPFSNCSHINGDSAELRFRTTLADAMEAFGLADLTA